MPTPRRAQTLTRNTDTAARADADAAAHNGAMRDAAETACADVG
jgi:hypothetical protein